MGNESIDYEAFFSAMGDTESDGGNQTAPETETAETEPSTDTEQQQAQEDTEGGKESAEESTPNAEENASEKAPATDGQQNEPQKFTIKYNHETREVELPEMTALAQKGADYDRIRGKLEEAQAGQAALQKTVDEQAPVLEVLQLAAKDAGVDVAAAKDAGVEVPELVDTIHVGLLKGRGMTEAEAKAEIRAAKAEKAMNDLKNKPASEEKAEDPNQERAKREIAEFQAAFPDVSLNQETLDKLAPDVQGGMTLTSAYLKLENSRLKTELAESQRKLEAEKQNQRNKQKAAPGQTDSGGGRSRDCFDDFFDAFER